MIKDPSLEERELIQPRAASQLKNLYTQPHPPDCCLQTGLRLAYTKTQAWRRERTKVKTTVYYAANT